LRRPQAVQRLHTTGGHTIDRHSDSIENLASVPIVDVSDEGRRSLGYLPEKSVDVLE
jgi:hypothetical protein